MRRARERSLTLLTAACLVMGGGCGDGRPPVESSTEEATVKGTVTVLGKPATGGNLTFDPSNVKRQDVPIRTTEIREDGTYQITTLVGMNSVSVNVPRGPKNPQMSGELGYDVQSGENMLDIPLPQEVDP